MSGSTVLILTTAGCSYCAKAKTLLKTFNQELLSQQGSKTSQPVHDLLLDVVSLNIPAEEDGKSTTIMPTAREAHTALSTKFEHSTFPLVVVLHSVDPSTLQQQQRGGAGGGIVMEYVGGFTELKERVDKVREKKSGGGGDSSELQLFPFPSSSLGEGTIVKIATDGGGGDQQDVTNWTSTGVKKLLSASGVTITSAAAAAANATSSSSEPAVTHSQLLIEAYGVVVSGGVNLLQEALSGQQTPTTQTPHPPRQTGAIHPEIYVSTFMGWHADAGAMIQAAAKTATTTTPLRSKQWITLLLDEARDRAALRRIAAVYAETTAAAAARGAEGSVPFADTILSVASSSEGQHRELPISLSDFSRFVLYTFPVSACVNKKETGGGEIVPVYYSNGAVPYAELPNKAAIEAAVGDEVLRSLSPGSEGSTTAISADTEKAVKEFLTPQQHGLLKRMCGGYLQTETERLLFGWVQPTAPSSASSSRLPATCWDEELVGAHSVQRQPRLFWTHASLLKSVLEPYSALYSSHVNAISSVAANDAGNQQKQKAITVTADALLSTLLRDGVVQLIKGENNNNNSDNIYRWTGRVVVSSNVSSGGGSTSTTLAPSRWYASGTRDTTTQRMSVPFPPPDLHSNTIINAEVRTIGSQHRGGGAGDDLSTTQQYDAIVNASAVLRSTMDALRDSFVEGPLPASSPLMSPVPLSKTEETLKDEVASAGGISGVRYDALGHSSTFAWAASSLLASHLGTYNPCINWNHFFTAAPRVIVTATLINLYNCLVTIRMAIVLGQKETHSSLPSSMITQYKFFYTKMVAFSSPQKNNNNSNSNTPLSNTPLSNTFSFSLDEIENGLLRGNRVGVSSMISKKGPFGAATEGGSGSDPRLGWAMNANDTDYRIHAALNCGASSCPPVRVFHSSNLNAQLHTAFTAFVQSTTKIQWKSPWTDSAVVTLLQKHNQTKDNVVSVSSLPPPPEITLSMIFKWYREDFTHPIPTHNYANETTTTKSSIDDVAIAAADSISAFCTDVSDQSVLGVIVKYLQPSKRESLLAWATLSRLATTSTPGQKSSNLSLSYSHYDWGNDAAAPNVAAK